MCIFKYMRIYIYTTNQNILYGIIIFKYVKSKLCLLHMQNSNKETETNRLPIYQITT